MSKDSPSSIQTARPKVEYPCRWPYKLICEDHERVEAIIPKVLAGYEFEFSISRQSRSGRYRSFHVTILVESEDARDEAFRQLKGMPTVRVVL